MSPVADPSVEALVKLDAEALGAARAAALLALGSYVPPEEEEPPPSPEPCCAGCGENAEVCGELELEEAIEVAESLRSPDPRDASYPRGTLTQALRTLLVNARSSMGAAAEIARLRDLALANEIVGAGGPFQVDSTHREPIYVARESELAKALAYSRSLAHRPFEPGDVVHLRSGGSVMTVAAVERDASQPGGWAVVVVWEASVPTGSVFQSTAPKMTEARWPSALLTLYVPYNHKTGERGSRP